MSSFRTPLDSEEKLFLYIKKNMAEKNYLKSKTLSHLFINYYPDSFLISEIKFHLAESYYNLDNYKGSLKVISDYLENYKIGESRPKILILKAEIYKKLKLQKLNEAVLKKIIIEYPKTKQAMLASISLRRIN